MKGYRLKVIGFILCAFCVSLFAEPSQQFTYYWYAAQQAIEHEDYPEAYTLLRFCQELNPDDANTLYSLGVIYEAMNDQARSMACFKRAYELAPEDCWPRYLEPLQVQYLREQKWKEALKVQDEIDRYKGYDAYSALTRYRIYAIQDKPKQALKAVDRYLETDPSDLRFQLFRVEILERMGAKKKALYAQYERVLELEPYHAMILNNYAYHLATHGGDLNKAEQMSSLAIREEPNNPVYLDTYGWILHLKGQDELAKFYLNKALWNAKQDEQKAEIQKHLEAIK